MGKYLSIDDVCAGHKSAQQELDDLRLIERSYDLARDEAHRVNLLNQELRQLCKTLEKGWKDEKELSESLIAKLSRYKLALDEIAQLPNRPAYQRNDSDYAMIAIRVLKEDV